jgi:hypothetical protein
MTQSPNADEIGKIEATSIAGGLHFVWIPSISWRIHGNNNPLPYYVVWECGVFEN